MSETLPPTVPPPRAATDSIADLVRRLIDDVILLIRSELRLAGGELREGVAGAAGSLGAIAIGMMFLSTATLCLLGAGVAYLAEFVGLVASALIVGVVALLIAAALIFTGIGRLKNLDLAPKRMVANLKRDVETLKGD